MNERVFLELCRQEVCAYTNKHLDKTDNKEITTDDVYVVWCCKTLQNNKALLSTTLFDTVLVNFLNPTHPSSSSTV